MSLTHLSLFSGIGGLDLAAEWAGFHTVGQVERADYPFRVLRRRFGRLPRWRNVEDVTEDALRRARITQPTVLSGGFPCQPFSVAGKRQGAEDDRYLWPEMLRVVRLARPTWIVGENVAGFVSMALDDVLADLVRAGYSGRAFVFPAAGVGAPHKRDRVFIVAYSNDTPAARQRRNGGEVLPIAKSEGSDLCGKHVADPSRELLNRGRGTRRRRIEPTDGGSNVLNSYGERCEECNPAPGGGEPRFPAWCSDPRGDLWLAEPPVGRVVDGIPSRVDRLRCLGNAVVPQQAYPIFAAIAAIETGAIA